MRILKDKISNIILATFVVTGLLSCSLEEELFDTPAPSNFLTSQEDLDNLIGGMYGYFADWRMYKGQTIQAITDLVSDNMIAMSIGTKITLGLRNYSSNQVEFANAWTAYYKIIGNANELIDVSENIELTTDNYNKSKGQGHFIRGFCYFNLVRLFGGVPIYTEPTGANTDFYAKRNSIEEVYEQILFDFTEASNRLLPKSSQPASEMGHANKGAADSYLALAYLTYANYLEKQGQDATNEFTKAKAYADSVINSNEYELVADFGRLWNVIDEPGAYKEVIFGITFTVDGSVPGKSSKGSELAHIYGPATGNGVAGYNGEKKSGWGHARIQAWFYDFCTTGEFSGDYRAEKSFLTTFPWREDPSVSRVTYPDINPTHGAENFPYLGKYVSSKGLPNNDENDMYLMRLAEVFLIKAEAENELNGPTAEAYDAFNQLRERARKADGNTRTTPANLESGLTKDEFRLKVFHERGIELVGEGHRWFDLTRMKAPSGISMYEYMHDQFIPQNYTAGTPIYNYSAKTWSDGRYNPSFVPSFEERYI